MTAPVPADGPDTLAYALRYAGVGLRVVPIRPGKKIPPMDAWQNAATTDKATITSWWTGLYRGHGIGLALGPLDDYKTTPTYVFAVDIDNHGISGEDTWHDLLAGRDVADTPTAITGGGGRHILFTSPVEVRNGLLGPGVDIRGAGGQIVVEPTIHPSGNAYQWEEGLEPWAVDIAQAPPWLLDLVVKPVEVPRTHPTTAPTGDRPGDLWAAETSWRSILEGDGWTYNGTGRDGEDRWTRPGKEKRDGISATTGYMGSDVLKVFTSSVPLLRAEETYTKLGYLAATRHHGDHSAAASELARRGYHVDPLVSWDGLGVTTSADAEPSEWPPLLPLDERPPLPPWPVHVLPEWIADHIVETADQLQVPPDLCAQFALGAIASVAMGYSEVVVGGRWREPLNLYLATALPSGGGKSPAEKAMTRPVRDWEKRQREASLDAVSEADVRRKILEKQAKDAETSASAGSRDISVAIDARKLLDSHIVVHPFRRLVDDATPEKLTQILAEQRGLIAVLSTEAELLDMAAGTYGRSPNINVYLKAYSGDPIMVDRKGGSTNPATELRIDKPLLTVGLAMQPTVIDFIGSQNTQLEGRGFLARFLFSCPKPTTGARDRSRVLDAPSTAAADRYNTELTHLADAWLWPVAPMTLTPEAERAFVAHLQSQEAEMTTRLAPVSEWVAKLQSAILRVAGILHLVDGNWPTDQIGPATIRRAAELGDYWIAHALAMAASSDHVLIEEAQTILASVERRKLTICTPRDVQMPFRKNRFEKVQDVVPALQFLEERGFLRVVEGEWDDVGVQRRSVRIEWRPRSVNAQEDETTESGLTRAKSITAYGDGERTHSLSAHSHTSPPDLMRVTRVIDDEAILADPVDNSTPIAGAEADDEWRPNPTWI